MRDDETRKRNRRRRFSLYLRWWIVVGCLVLPAYAPQASDKAAVPARETKQKSATVAARKQTLSILLSTAGRLQRANDTRRAIQTLNEAGHLQLDLDLTEEALVTFKQSQALLGQETDPITNVDTLNGLASAYIAGDQCKKAEPLSEQARTKSEQYNYPTGKAEALLSLSYCQNILSNHSLALSTANEALALWQSISNDLGVLRTHLQIGRYYFAQSSLEEATHEFQTALDLAIKIGDPRLQAESLIYLGYVEHRKVAWHKLSSFMLRAEGLIDGEAEPFLMGQIKSGLAESFIETGLTEVGLQKYEEALEHFRETEYPSGLVGMSWGIGKAQFILEKYPEALAIFKQTLADAQSHDLPTWVAQSHEYLGRTYAKLNQPTEALEQFEAALGVYVTKGNPMETARVRALIGQLYQTQGKLDEALQFYQLALQTFAAINDHLDRSATLFVMGQLEMKRGNFEGAENYLRQSIETTENVRSMSTTIDLTAAFSATVHDRYLQYIQCLMSRHDKQGAIQAFEISESARARSLAEFLRRTETNLLVKLDAELAKQEQSLRHQLQVKENIKVTLLMRNYTKAELTQIDTEIAHLEEQYKSVSATISERYPRYDQITRPHAWDLSRIQNQVVSDDDTVLLEYILGVEKSYVWAITRDSLTAHEITGEVSKAAETVYKLAEGRPEAGDEKQLTEAARALSQIILSPVASHLNKRRIIVIPDGALNYIPFQMLPAPADSQPLVAQHQIINAPSASILGELREEVSSRGVRSKVLAAFGNPAFGSSQPNDNSDQIASANTSSDEHLRYALRDIELNRDNFDFSAIGELFFAEREINNLREIATPAATFTATGFAANREQLFSMDFSQFAILHFATHGFLDPKHPEHSGILLSTVDNQGNQREGFLALQDIYSLRAPVDLVVLSACRTGLGKEIRGEGLVGLTRGFMYAGATTVVASLWKVDDEATSELMKRFYVEMLQNRKSPDEALRIAQDSIRQIPKWSAPHYWAGFTLQGEYQYVVNSERGWKRYSILIVIGILVIVLVSVVGWYRYRGPAPASAVK